MNRVPHVASALLLAVALGGVACCQRQTPEPGRPTTWAQPIAHPPLENLHQLTPQVYRGAQPDAAGMRELERMGILTVLNLRGLHSDHDELGGTGLAYRHITFQTWHAEDEDVVEFLRIVSKPENLPIYIHCHHGSDRTGTMCAIYRMAFQGWTKQEAIAEMTQGGFGYHTMWSNLIDYLQHLDIDRLKREAGL